MTDVEETHSLEMERLHICRRIREGEITANQAIRAYGQRHGRGAPVEVQLDYTRAELKYRRRECGRLASVLGGERHHLAAVQADRRGQREALEKLYAERDQAPTWDSLAAANRALEGWHQRRRAALAALDENATDSLEFNAAALVATLRKLLGEWIAVPPPGGPDDGHLFIIGTRMRGSYSVADEPGHHDAEEWRDNGAVLVRAWSLREALRKATALPLDAWPGLGNDEPPRVDDVAALVARLAERGDQPLMPWPEASQDLALVAYTIDALRQAVSRG